MRVGELRVGEMRRSPMWLVEIIQWVIQQVTRNGLSPVEWMSDLWPFILMWRGSAVSPTYCRPRFLPWPDSWFCMWNENIVLTPRNKRQNWMTIFWPEAMKRIQWTNSSGWCHWFPKVRCPQQHRSPEWVPLVITYHPALSRTVRILRKHLNILHVSDTLKVAIPYTPIVALRSSCNLRELLVQAKLKMTNTPTQTGNSPYNSTCCKTWSHDDVRGKLHESQYRYKTRFCWLC